MWIPFERAICGMTQIIKLFLKLHKLTNDVRHAIIQWIRMQCFCSQKLHAILIVSPNFGTEHLNIESEAAFCRRLWPCDSFTKLLTTVCIFITVCNVTSPPINNWPLVRHIVCALPLLHTKFHLLHSELAIGSEMHGLTIRCYHL